MAKETRQDAAGAASAAAVPPAPAVAAPYVDTAVLIGCGALGLWDGMRVIVTKQDSFDATISGAWIAVLGAALIVLAIVHAILASRAAGPAPVPGAGTVRTRWAAVFGELRPGLFAFALMAAFALLLTRAGYLVCAAVFMAVHVGWFGAYRRIAVVLGSVAFAVITAYLFARMRVELPQGLLPWP